MVYGLKIPTPPAPDAGDAREFQLQAAASTAGPWREQASFKGPLDGSGPVPFGSPPDSKMLSIFINLHLCVLPTP